jgi:hypothetical protein
MVVVLLMRVIVMMVIMMTMMMIMMRHKHTGGLYPSSSTEGLKVTAFLHRARVTFDGHSAPTGRCPIRAAR